MQRMLEKMAARLNEYDEASLMSLWETYAERVYEFEPGRRWEEATLCLCLIQAVRWKNQLFNYRRLASLNPADISEPPMFTPVVRGRKAVPEEKKKAHVLSFPPKNPKNEE